MKKITIAILMFLGTFSFASAEVGVNVGVSGQLGGFTADAEETMGTTDRGGQDDGIMVVGYSSIFIEKTLGDYFTVGVDYVPEDLDTEAVSTTRDKLNANGTFTDTVQDVKVSFQDMYTYYAALNLTENFYVKAGMVEVDLITQETLGTGGTYGNTSLDGTMMGAGYNKDLINGIFIRAEGNYIDFDDVTLNSSGGNTRFIKATSIAGLNGKLSIGKSF